MKQHFYTAIVAIIAVALALVLFFSGFFVRGLVDREIALADPTVTVQPPRPQLITTQSTPTLEATSILTDISTDDDPALGPTDAQVTIIEFSDYQCPFCKRYVDETLPLILDTYGDRIRYVFRDFPIEQLHPQAMLAAQAAQCAFEQGKFWEYHDMLFQNQGALDTKNLKEYAVKLGLDQATFDGCLDSGEYFQEVQEDFDDALTHGVTGTPTFFINGHKFVGTQSFATLQIIIEQELEKVSVP